MKGPRRLVAVAGIAAVAILWPAGAASAHPLGNFTVNHYAGVEVAPGELRVVYALDIAEIPTQQLHAEMDTDADGAVDAAELQVWADGTGDAIARGIDVTVDGRPLTLAPSCGSAAFRDGQAGLAVTRFDGLFTAPIPERGHMEVEDTTDGGRVGWREIIAVGVDGRALSGSTVPAQSVSDELRRYPTDLLSSPLGLRTASFDFAPGSTDTIAAATCDSATTTVGARPLVEGGLFAGLVDNHGLPLVGLAVLLAVAFGAWHALLPGHGKTLMAAYMVGSEAKARQAVAVGSAVAIMHTASVLALGLLVLTLEQTFRPETLYPWLGLLSGLVALGLGAYLLISRVGSWMEAKRHAEEHAHIGVHDHDHGVAGHAHPEVVPAGSALSRKGLMALALAGGILPAPSALIVMLAAINGDRVVFGLSLVLAFSVGLATALIVVGMGALRARDAVARRMSTFWGRMVPVLSASAILGVGAFLSLRGLAQL